MTPQGEPFYASGIDTVAPDGSGTDQITGVCPYCDTVANDFPSTLPGRRPPAQLRSWGFNSLGPFSDDADLGSQMPYEVQLSMASGNDWFAPRSSPTPIEVAATQVAPLAEDPNVIGYFTDSELDWGPFLGNGSGRHSDGPSAVSAVAGRFARPGRSPAVRGQSQRVSDCVGHPLLLGDHRRRPHVRHEPPHPGRQGRRAGDRARSHQGGGALRQRVQHRRLRPTARISTRRSTASGLPIFPCSRTWPISKPSPTFRS